MCFDIPKTCDLDWIGVKVEIHHKENLLVITSTRPLFSCPLREVLLLEVMCYIPLSICSQVQKK